MSKPVDDPGKVGRWIAAKRLSRRIVLAAVVVVPLIALMPPPFASAAPGATTVAQAVGTRDSELEPKYRPREPEPVSSYDSRYLFGMTKSVADSTIAPVGKVPLFVLTVPLDIVFLPFAAIGGLF